MSEKLRVLTERESESLIKRKKNKTTLHCIFKNILSIHNEVSQETETLFHTQNSIS